MQKRSNIESYRLQKLKAVSIEVVVLISTNFSGCLLERLQYRLNARVVETRFSTSNPDLGNSRLSRKEKIDRFRYGVASRCFRQLGRAHVGSLLIFVGVLPASAESEGVEHDTWP